MKMRLLAVSILAICLPLSALGQGRNTLVMETKGGNQTKIGVKAVGKPGEESEEVERARARIREGAMKQREDERELQETVRRNRAQMEYDRKREESSAKLKQDLAKIDQKYNEKIKKLEEERKALTPGMPTTSRPTR